MCGTQLISGSCDECYEHVRKAVEHVLELTDFMNSARHASHLTAIMHGCIHGRCCKPDIKAHACITQKCGFPFGGMPKCPPKNTHTKQAGGNVKRAGVVRLSVRSRVMAQEQLAEAQKEVKEALVAEKLIVGPAAAVVGALCLSPWSVSHKSTSS